MDWFRFLFGWGGGTFSVIGGGGIPMGAYIVGGGGMPIIPGAYGIFLYGDSGNMLLVLN